MSESEKYLEENGLERQYGVIEITFQGLLDHLEKFNYEQNRDKNIVGLDNATLRYSVSLVFVSARESLLRCLITDAINEYEAFGKAIEYFKEETGDFNLSMKVVIPIYNT